MKKSAEPRKLLKIPDSIFFLPNKYPERFIFKKYFIFVYLIMCMVGRRNLCSVRKGQQRAQSPRGLEVQAVVSPWT